MFEKNMLYSERFNYEIYFFYQDTQIFVNWYCNEYIEFEEEDDICCSGQKVNHTEYLPFFKEPVVPSQLTAAVVFLVRWESNLPLVVIMAVFKSGKNAIYIY